MMSSCVPLITGFLTFLVVRRAVFKKDSGDDRILALLLASVLWGAYLALITEALSFFEALRFGPLLVAWALPIPMLLVGLFQSASRRAISSSASSTMREPGRARPTPARRLTADEIGILSTVFGIIAFTGLVAWASAPNTWDSMAYHLPRIMQWAQNASIAHYPTHEPRQLYLSPWAEEVGTHFWILGGGDRAIRMTQWFAMVGCLLAAYSTAGRLGADRGGRILSLLAVVSLPTGLLQAVSTQTDYVVSFHVLAAARFFLSDDRRTLGPHFWGAAMSTALAVLSKGTAYFVLTPFLGAFVGRQFKLWRANAWRPLAVFGAMVLAINFGHYARNLNLFDSPLQPQGLGAYHRYGNEARSVGVTASNAIRHAALHLTLASPDLVAHTYDKVRDLHQIFGLDPEDPRTTWPSLRFEPPPQQIHEDYSGNLLHLALTLVCLFATTRQRIRRRYPEAVRHLWLATAGGLLFVALLKWTPWSARLHLPLFVLMAPAVATLLARVPPPLTLAVAMTWTVQAIPFVALNPLHPLTGKESIFQRSSSEQMLRVQPRLGEFYAQATERLTAAGCHQIGLDMPPDAWEYPLWSVLHSTYETPPRLQSLRPDNVTERLQDPRFEPCALVCLSCRTSSRAHSRLRFGEPILVAVNDLPGRSDHLLFIAR